MTTDTTTATESAPSPPTPPVTPASPVEPYRPVDPRYAAQWIAIEKENLAAGKISPEEATRRLDALGATPEQRAPDTRSAEVKALDTACPVAKPEEFVIRYGSPGQVAPEMTPEMKQFDSSARTWLSGAEFTRDGGSAFVDMIAKVSRQTQHLNADELESYGYAEFAKLERAYGGEDILQEKLHAAAVMIDALDKTQPGLKNLLRSKGIGDNALVVAQIISQAERWHARRKGW